MQKEKRDRKQEMERTRQCMRKRGTGNGRRRGLDSIGGEEGQETGDGEDQTVQEEKRDRKREKVRTRQCRRRRETGNGRWRGPVSAGGKEGQETGEVED